MPIHKLVSKCPVMLSQVEPRAEALALVIASQLGMFLKRVRAVQAAGPLG